MCLCHIQLIDHTVAQDVTPRIHLQFEGMGISLSTCQERRTAGRASVLSPRNDHCNDNPIPPAFEAHRSHQRNQYRGELRARTSTPFRETLRTDDEYRRPLSRLVSLGFYGTPATQARDTVNHRADADLEGLSLEARLTHYE